MTTEEDFQNHLDANPGDHNARGVFGDWLEENNNPKANGYRALGKLRIRPDETTHPTLSSSGGATRWYTYKNGAKHKKAESIVPEDWFKLIKLRTQNGYKKVGSIRKDTEDAAAHAFSQLPQERQHELLGLNTPHQMSRKDKYSQRRKSYKRYVHG